MIRSEKAASEVIGMVLILGIMMLAIGIIMLTAVPMIESGKSRARMDVAMSSFQTLSNDIEEVVRGPIWVKDPYSVTNVSRLGPSRDTEFQLMGGMLAVSDAQGPDRTVFKVLNIKNLTNPKADNLTVTGRISYSAEQEEIVYENGALIRKYEAGDPLMLSNPLITIYNTLDSGAENRSNISISIHAVNITGKLSSTGGKGKSRIEIRPGNYSQIIEPGSSPNINQVNISIQSKYPEAWKEFFDNALKNSGLIRRNSNNNTQTGYYVGNISGTMPLEIRIFGNYNDARKDLFLSAYESELDVIVR